MFASYPCGNNALNVYDDEQSKNAVSYTHLDVYKRQEVRFDDYVKNHPEAKGMATTLTMVSVGASGITLAHIGDSRIYQFRQGEIIYQTEDHSLVNSLVKLGKISKEEALTHPQKNVIIRAIQGSEHPTEADVVILKDIQAGDYFFMCTDGVLERLKNEDLSSIFSTYNNPEDIKDGIMAACCGKTRDNFSFYILPVQKDVYKRQSRKRVAIR